MQNDNRAVYFVLIIFALFIIAGFFFVFDSIGSLRNDVKDMQVSLLYAPQDTVSPNTNGSSNASSSPNGQSGGMPVPEPAPTSTPNTDNTAAQNAISTAIILQTKSSPALLPQTDVTITIQNVARSADGTVAVNFKAYTSNANGYSAITPSTLFQLISMDGTAETANTVNGSFSSMPPKSVITGNVTFSSDPSKSSIILQVGATDVAHFYTFDFINKTYKETPIG